MFTKLSSMDSIFAPGIDGTYQQLYGSLDRGLFFHRLEQSRYLFRHAASGLSLFYFLGCDKSARDVLAKLAGAYNFHRDSTWVLKGQSEIHALLKDFGLRRRWLYRAWHYEHPEQGRSSLTRELELPKSRSPHLLSETRVPTSGRVEHLSDPRLSKNSRQPFNA